MVVLFVWLAVPHIGWQVGEPWVFPALGAECLNGSHASTVWVDQLKVFRWSEVADQELLEGCPVLLGVREPCEESRPSPVVFLWAVEQVVPICEDVGSAE